MSNGIMWRIIGAAAIIAIGVFLFFGQDKRVAEAPATAGVPAASPAEPVQEIVVKANNWYFDPENIRVKAGTKARIVVQGVTGIHTFAIPALSVESDEVQAGETATVEFVADKRGEFPFKCSVFCGEGHSGMKGMLIVE